MNLTVKVLLLILAVVTERSNADDMSLNFQQHDYQLKFERLELMSYNKDIVEYGKIVTFKYNRTLAVINGTFTFKIALGDDLVAVVQVYKFMSNEYRHFPLRFAANCCKALSLDVAGMSGFDRCGNFTKCPLEKGVTYHACNWYPNPTKLPPYIPSGQFKINMQMLHFSTEVSVTNAYVTVTRPEV